MKRYVATFLTTMVLAAGGGLAGCAKDDVVEEGTVSSVEGRPTRTRTFTSCTVALQPDSGKSAHEVSWTRVDWCLLVATGSYSLRESGAIEVAQREYAELVDLKGCHPVYQLTGSQKMSQSELGATLCAQARNWLEAKGRGDSFPHIEDVTRLFTGGMTDPKPLPT